MLAIQDLTFPNPALDRAHFYGRESELERIRYTLTSGTGRTIIILGERRMGKTSLQTVSARLVAQATGGLYVPILWPIDEHRSIHSLDEYAVSLLRNAGRTTVGDAWQDGIRRHGGSIHFTSDDDFLADMSRLLSGHPGKTFILCIDELDAIVQNCSSASEKMDVVGLTQRLINQWPRLPIVLSIAATRWSDDVKDSYGSPFAGSAEVLLLGPMPPAEVNEMVVHLLPGQVALCDAAMQRLYSLSGGSPYFTKLLLSVLLRCYREASPPLEITEKMVDRVIPEAATDQRASAPLANLYDVHFSGAERSLLLLMAGREQGMTHEEVHNLGPSYVGAAKALARRSYLRVDAQGQWVMQSELLAAWLRRWERYETECARWGGERPPGDLRKIELSEAELRRFGMRF